MGGAGLGRGRVSTTTSIIDLRRRGGASRAGQMAADADSVRGDRGRVKLLDGLQQRTRVDRFC